MYSPVDNSGVLLVWFKELFLMGGEWGVVLLVRLCMEGMGEHVAVEAHTGFKEGVWVFDAITDEGG
jgi:hypothetical protein